MWMALTQLNGREESFVVSLVVLHPCAISIHPPSCSNRNSSSRKPISLLYTKAWWITAAAAQVRKVHKTSSCCPLSRPRRYKQGCPQVVRDLLTWVEASGCHFCSAVCWDHSFRRKSSAIVSSMCWWKALWFSVRRRGPGGAAPAVSVWFTAAALFAGCVVRGICGREEEQMAVGWHMCIRGTDVWVEQAEVVQLLPRMRRPVPQASLCLRRICYLYVTFWIRGRNNLPPPQPCFWPLDSHAPVFPSPPLSPS